MTLDMDEIYVEAEEEWTAEFEEKNNREPTEAERNEFVEKELGDLVQSRIEGFYDAAEMDR